MHSKQFKDYIRLPSVTKLGKELVTMPSKIGKLKVLNTINPILEVFYISV